MDFCAQATTLHDRDDAAPRGEGGGIGAAIGRIDSLAWETLDARALTEVASAYYYFSIQFREALEQALRLYPQDPKLRHLAAEECATDNLSPWPGVAGLGERLDHDEFMRRTVALQPLPAARARHLEAVGTAYLAMSRSLPPPVRAASIASYEDGGLERVFRAMLRAPCWEGPVLGAFWHFVTEHIRFDSDAEAGHGALARHMRPDARVIPLWDGFRTMLVAAAPALEPGEACGG